MPRHDPIFSTDLERLRWSLSFVTARSAYRGQLSALPQRGPAPKQGLDCSGLVVVVDVAVPAAVLEMELASHGPPVPKALASVKTEGRHCTVANDRGWRQ